MDGALNAQVTPILNDMTILLKAIHDIILAWKWQNYKQIYYNSVKHNDIIHQQSNTDNIRLILFVHMPNALN